MINSEGKEVGKVVGKKIDASPQHRQDDDGGFGSVANLLLSASESTGAHRFSHLGCQLQASIPITQHNIPWRDYLQG